MVLIFSHSPRISTSEGNPFNNLTYSVRKFFIRVAESDASVIFPITYPLFLGFGAEEIETPLITYPLVSWIFLTRGE